VFVLLLFYFYFNIKVKILLFLFLYYIILPRGIFNKKSDRADPIPPNSFQQISLQNYIILVWDLVDLCANSTKILILHPTDYRIFGPNIKKNTQKRFTNIYQSSVV